MPAAARNDSHDPYQDPPLTRGEQLRAAKEIVRREAAALWDLSNRLGESFNDALGLIAAARGSVIVTGMGKAGLIGQKIAATLASTGTPAHFLHPAEAFHGDLGRVGKEDVVLMLTQSGETGEVTQLLPSLREIGAPIVAVTASQENTVGSAAAAVIELGRLDEACSLGLAPSTSTTAMLAIGDALALVLSRLNNFQAEDFAKFHPGGSLGRKLSRVDDCLRPLAECRVAAADQTTRDALLTCSKPGRRTGAIMVLAADQTLAGIFTDSDLARLLENGGGPEGGCDGGLDGGLDGALARPITELMCATPTTIPAGAKLTDAITLLADKKFSELPVIGPDGKPLGLLDVTDVVGWQPEAESPTPSPTKPAIRVFPGEDVFAAG